MKKKLPFGFVVQQDKKELHRVKRRSFDVSERKRRPVTGMNDHSRRIA